MKSLLAVIIMISSAAAYAGEQDYQSKECGTNVAQVQRIIDEHPKWDLDDNWASKFIGSWGEDGRIKVEANGNSFSYKGYLFKACPQADGAMFIISLDDSSKTAVLRRHNKNLIVLSGYEGMGAATVNGAYPRQGTTLTATGRGGRQF